MSVYTTEVRFICETLAGYTESQGYSKVDEIIASARTKIFDFDYPIFDATYKPILEKKILKHYYTREICEETVGLWKLRLNEEMNLIMPYFNQLYASELLEFNPFYDVNITRDYNKQSDGESSLSGTNWDKYSDTPQGAVTGIDNDTYLTEARKLTTSNESEVSNTDDYLEHIVGKHGGYSYSELLQQYRDTFLNIDEMVINRLSDLFMQLW